MLLQAYVSSVSDVLEICCKFFMDVAKVDWDVAYDVMTIHVCCKCMFPMFHLFQIYVACCSGYTHKL
jgi:hypothetical protein